MTKFSMALLYAGIVGWEIKLDDQGNWTLPYFCTEGRKNDTVDEILSGEAKIGIYDTLEDYINKQTRQVKKTEPLKKVSKKDHKDDSWLFKIMRRWGMI